ncbi:MAG: 30S ribosomal protein S2 [Bacteroidetes bacterium]|nr:30S ribosomal protein S2 [Bacteroidota bacterium]MDA0942900.1 30S ribosomal protein S2 [Bacteroidota bacterium]MDA1110958.1 30S ribosomal protein S2 [Bacteroidota bacterium]
MAYTQQDLMDAGVHFGHLTRKWNPKMAPYIFMEQNGIHIIDLKKTEAKLEEAKSAIRNIAKSGRRILFVATKKQAKEIVSQEAQRAGMPYVTERWLGGMLTNFQTVRRSIKRMQVIDRMATDGTFERINKKERLMLDREKAKLSRMLGGIEDMTKLPGAIFMVDVKREHIAVAEAMRLNIPTFALVDTNSDPTNIDFAIPGNDDASKSIHLIVSELANAILEGSAERKKEKNEEETKKVAVEAETQEG